MERIHEYGRADSGFYCREAVEACEEFDARFAISARKTSRLVEQLRHAEWKLSPKTDGDAECEFHYQPDGWKKPYRFVALRYEKAREETEPEESEQYPDRRSPRSICASLSGRIEGSNPPPQERGLERRLPTPRSGFPDSPGNWPCLPVSWPARGAAHQCRQ